jgi:hypothetical protein
MQMKRLLSVLACAIVVPVAFAQTNRAPTNLITPPPSHTDDVPGTATGLVTAFLPGQTITVKTQAANPMSFALSKTMKVVDSKGKAIKLDKIRPGARVRVSYEGNEDTRTATRILVER